MRWSRLLPLCLLALFSFCLQAQIMPDFSDAVDPGELDAIEIFRQIDTASAHRVPVVLNSLETDFIQAQDLTVETYYQKSDTHHLLQLSKFRMPVTHLLVMVEGIGKTYFRISDGVCTITTMYQKSSDRLDHLLLDRNCTL